MNAWLVALGIFLCGGLGSVARFLVHRLVLSEDPADFPLGTFIVNVSGAFLIGLLFGASLGNDAMKVAATGFLGGFTTFSTWIYESERLAVDGHGANAARNIGISSGLGLIAVSLGVVLGRLL